MVTISQLFKKISYLVTKEDKNRYIQISEDALNLFKQKSPKVLGLINDIKKIIRHYDLYYFEAIVYSYLENHEKVIESCKKGLGIKETYYLYDRIAIAYHQLEQYDLALEMFDKAIKLDDSIFEIYYDKAITLIDLHKDEEAIKLLNKVIAINPDYSNAYKEIAFIFFEMKNYNKSYSSFIEYVRLTNEHKGYYYLALILYESDEIEIEIDKYIQILTYINKAISISKEKNIFKSYYFMLKADTLLVLYREKEADFCYKIVINNPESDIEDIEEALSFLSYRVFNKDKELALDYINRAIDISKESWYFTQKGRIFYHLKKYDEAIMNLQKALDINSSLELEDTYYYISLVKFRKNNINQALFYINEAIKIQKEKKFINLKKYLERLQQ